jgi:hypothetical protein
MNQEKALLLAEALESGKYNQGYRVLERHTVQEDGSVKVTNCCLGVATRLAQEAGVQMDEVLDRSIVEFDGNSTSMTPKVAAWFGFRTQGAAFGDNEKDAEQIEGRSSLIGLNDEGDHTFADIARIIRENWERL